MRTCVLVTALAAATLSADEPRLPDGQRGFQGTWTIVSLEYGGKKGDDPIDAGTVVFRADRYAIKAGDKTVEEGTFRADAEQTPNRIDVAATSGKDKGMKWHGVYELEGDTLRAVVGPADRDRPKSLANPPEGTRGFTLKRVKP